MYMQGVCSSIAVMAKPGDHKCLSMNSGLDKVFHGHPLKLSATIEKDYANL